MDNTANNQRRRIVRTPIATGWDGAAPLTKEVPSNTGLAQHQIYVVATDTQATTKVTVSVRPAKSGFYVPVGAIDLTKAASGQVLIPAVIDAVQLVASAPLSSGTLDGGILSVSDDFTASHDQSDVDRRRFGEVSIPTGWNGSAPVTVGCKDQSGFTQHQFAITGGTGNVTLYGRPVDATGFVKIGFPTASGSTDAVNASGALVVFPGMFEAFMLVASGTLSGAMDAQFIGVGEEMFFAPLSGGGGGGSGEVPWTYDPMNISPADGATVITLSPSLQGNQYYGLYDIPQAERQYQVDLASGDFSDPVFSGSTTPSSPGANDAPAISTSPLSKLTEYQWRFRDELVGGNYGDWSEPTTFSTPDASLHQDYLSISGVWTPPDGISSVDVIVVGGGGSSSAYIVGSDPNYTTYSGGGGGGGQVVKSVAYPVSGPVSVIIGAGGSSQGSSTPSPGHQGGSSSFGTVVAYGGGGAGAYGVAAVLPVGGGSGGGGAASEPGASGVGVGSHGGSSGTSTSTGGGGGAGGGATDATTNIGGNGGIPLYGFGAGGGGGGNYVSGGRGGSNGDGVAGSASGGGSGGGQLTSPTSFSGSPGAPATGGGAGGSRYVYGDFVYAAPGGSGACVVSYYSVGRVQIALTAGNQWTVPPDWNDADNKVECIGSGASVVSGSGGGGAYAMKKNLALTPGEVVSYQIGNPALADTWFVDATTVKAAGATSSPGGQASASVGDVKYSGGSGGGSPGAYSSGGAAGPNGPGGNGNSSAAGSGDAGHGGVGGKSGNANGGNGTEWGNTGSGGGGFSGGLAGSYGGGGGAGSVFLGTGLIVITYAGAARADLSGAAPFAFANAGTL